MNQTKKKIRRLSGPAKGFTLLEVLLATVVGTLVLVVAFMTYRSVATGRELSGYYSEMMAQGRYALGQFRDDLANFYRCRDVSRMRLVGTKGVKQQDADRLKLYVVSDRKVGSETAEGEVYEVEYGLSQIDSEHESQFLLRRCGPVTDESQGNKAGEVIQIARNVSRLEFEYYDGEEWQGQWQQEEGEFPWLVRINLVLQDPAGQAGAISFSQEVSLLPFRKHKPELVEDEADVSDESAE